MSEEFELSSEEEVPQSNILSSLLDGFTSPSMSSNIQLERGTKYSAGYDLRSTISLRVTPHTTVAIDTGVKLTIPQGYYMQLCTRSSIALRDKRISSSGITTTISSVIVLAGIIDSDYTGEIKVIVHNLGNTDYIVNVGDKIAQGIIHKFHTLDNEIIVKDDSFTHEGFGSTN